MLLLLLLLSLSLTPQSGSLEIESLSVPSYVVSGNSAIMSCYYSVPDDRLPELDIKWYHANSPAPFLVYLPHHWSSPHVVDARMSSMLEMVTSTASRLMFRLNNVTQDMAGLYSCKVSTYADETLATQRLTVIDPPKINLSVLDNGNGEVKIGCLVSNIQARLIVTLSVNGRNIDIIDITNDGQTTNNNTSSAKATVTINLDDNMENDIECAVNIPDTIYTWRSSRSYHHDSHRMPYLPLISSSTCVSRTLLSVLCILQIITSFMVIKLL